MKALALTMLLLLPAASHADSSYCPSLANVAQNVKDCSQNDAYIEAAKNCQAKLSKEIAAAQAALGIALQSQQAAATSAQVSQVENHVQSVAAAQATIQNLYESMAQVHNEVAAYAEHFVWPGGLSESTVDHLSLRAFFYQFPCYGPNQQTLSKARLEIDKQVQSLGKTATALGLFNTRDQQAKKELQGGGAPSRTPASGLGTSAPTKVGPPRQNGASDITGTRPPDPSSR